MSEKEKPFTVSDRRHFAPDGRAREEAESAADATVAGEPIPPAAEAADRQPRTAQAQVTFTGFLLSLAAQAAALLSDTGEQAGETSALEAARQIVSILEMLKDKTEGRRTPDESGVLDDLLFQLRLAYVQRQESGKK